MASVEWCHPFMSLAEGIARGVWEGPEEGQLLTDPHLHTVKFLTFPALTLVWGKLFGLPTSAGLQVTRLSAVVSHKQRFSLSRVVFLFRCTFSRLITAQACLFFVRPCRRLKQKFF